MAKKEIIDIKDIDSTDRKQKIKDFPNDNRTVERYLKDRIENSKREVNIKIPKPVYDKLKDSDKWKAIQEYIINRNVKEIIDKSIIEVEKLLEKDPEISTPYNLVDEIPIMCYNGRYHENENNYNYYANDFNDDLSRLEEIYYNIHHEVINNVYKKFEGKTIRQLREALKEDDEKINKLEEKLENWREYHEKEIVGIRKWYDEELEREKRKLQE